MIEQVVNDGARTMARREAGPSPDVIEQVIGAGDLSQLTPAQRSTYYHRVCESLGLNPLTRPFEFLNLSGKMVLYARKDATDQLRSLRKVNIEISSRERVDGLYVVTARATLPDGRCDEEIGAVPVERLQGEGLANAMMKATTKAKRRVTLSVCGLGMLDESELEGVPQDQIRVVEQPRAALNPQRVAEVEQATREAMDKASKVEVPESRRAPEPAQQPAHVAQDAEWESLGPDEPAPEQEPPPAQNPPPPSQATPRPSRKYGEAHSLWKACKAQGICEDGHEPQADMPEEDFVTFIENWKPLLQAKISRR